MTKVRAMRAEMRGFRAHGRLLSIGRQESYKRPEVFFLIERMRVRTRVDARNEDQKGSLRREQRTGM
jgi:hypothetical protein